MRAIRNWLKNKLVLSFFKDFKFYEVVEKGQPHFFGGGMPPDHTEGSLLTVRRQAGYTDNIN